MKAGDWKVISLTIGGASAELLPMWTISDCDIYEEECIGVWSAGANATTDFAWRFREKGSRFDISRQEGNTPQTAAAIEIAQQCYNLSGEYEVSDADKTGMRFVSSMTIGYPGEEVIIEIGK